MDRCEKANASECTSIGFSVRVLGASSSFHISGRLHDVDVRATPAEVSGLGRAGGGRT